MGKDKRPFEGEEIVVYRGDVPPGEVTIPVENPEENGPSHHTLGGINGQIGVPASLVEKFEAMPMIERGLDNGSITKTDPRELAKKATKAQATAPAVTAEHPPQQGTAAKTAPQR